MNRIFPLFYIGVAYGFYILSELALVLQSSVSPLLEELSLLVGIGYSENCVESLYSSTLGEIMGSSLSD